LVEKTAGMKESLMDAKLVVKRADEMADMSAGMLADY
jgi:hypothetical protein